MEYFRKVTFLKTVEYIMNLKTLFFSKPHVFVLIFFGLLFASISFVNHYYFRTYAFDLGIINNSIWDYAHFRWNNNTVMQPSFDNLLSDHFTLLPIIASPLYWIFGSYTLLLVQIVALLGGAYGVYQFVLLKSENKFLSTIASIHFLSMWGVYSALGFDYHDNVIAAAILPLFFYYLEQSKWKCTLIVYTLILISKENMALWMAFVCLGAALLYCKDTSKRNRLILMSLFSAIYMVLIIKVVIPALGNADREYLHFHYSMLGGDMKEALFFMIQHPIKTIKLLFMNPTGSNVEAYKMQLHIAVIMSGGVFLIFRPQYLIMLIPIYAQKLFSDDGGKWGIGAHYCIEFAPIIVLATYDCISGVRTVFIRYVVSIGTLFLTMYTTYQVLENQIIWWQEKNNVQFYKKEHYQNDQVSTKELYSIIQKIPVEAVISAQSTLVSHLAFRDKIYLYPFIRYATYILLVPSQQDTYPLSKENYSKSVQDLLKNTDWEIKFQSKNTLLMKRVK